MSGGTIDMGSMYIRELGDLTQEQKKAIGKLISAMRDRCCLDEFTALVNMQDTSAIAKLLSVVVEEELKEFKELFQEE